MLDNLGSFKFGKIARVSLTLVFLSFFRLAFAAAPTVVSITPSSGSTTPGTPRTFSCSYIDPDGWDNLKEASLLISTNSTLLTNVSYLYYDQNTNLLYLRNDANTSWLGGYTPGSANIIENSQAKLNCNATTISNSTSMLTVNYNVTFKPTYSGKTYNTYLYVKDDTGGYAGWIKEGTYTVNYPPQVGSVTPASGTGQIGVPQVFTTTYSDPDGWQNIQYVYFLISSSTSTSTACLYAYYNQNTNKLYLRNDANTAWLGGYAPGSANTIENSYVKLNCTLSSVSGSGTTMTVNWSVTIKAPFTGTKYIYLYVQDDVNAYQTFVQKGTWSIPNTPPQVGSLTPSQGTSAYDQQVIFSATYTDPDTWQNLEYLYLLFNTAATYKNCYYAYYNQNTNKLYLRNDADTAWLGGFAPGSSKTIENSYAKLDCSKTQASGGGNTLTIQWAITFKLPFSGTKNCYLNAKDNANVYQGWVQKGTWTISDGTLIGPEGGEVLSLDGKVRLIIPANALTQPTRILIININNQDLQSAQPQGTSLLSVVECSPFGLTFAKPARIIYTFNQAEVPGTPVELGLYDGVNITPTGQTSVVSTDGYTASFSIDHFSTYAALKDLTPQNIPIGAGVRIPLPDMFTGAFSHAIPITVPPARKGMQPAIALCYRSSNPNSWVGVGFSLNPGCIVRSTRLGPPAYDDTKDTFYFITDAGTIELVHLTENLYQAKIESSFTKFFKEADDSWKVVGKDGSILKFGESSDAKEGSAQGTFSWYVTKAQDTNGNYIDYTYIKDAGKSYLSKIDYTGNTIGVYPTNSVEFFLESRDDISSNYLSGSKIAVAKRLKEILVKVNSALAWRYELEYSYSPDTKRSLLKAITQFGSDGKSLPTQTLSYQKGE